MRYRYPSLAELIERCWFLRAIAIKMEEVTVQETDISFRNELKEGKVWPLGGCEIS
jgi:hypothetical protein